MVSVSIRNSIWFVIFGLIGACSSGTLAPVVSRVDEPVTSTSVGKPLADQPAPVAMPDAVESTPVVTRLPLEGETDREGPNVALPEYHTVTGGETLYSIAWRYGVDYRLLAEWNAIPEPYLIHPSQRLRLSPPDGLASATQIPPTPSIGGDAKLSAPATIKTPTVELENRIPEIETSPPPTTILAPPQPPASPDISKSAAIEEPTLPAKIEGPIKWQWPTQGRANSSSDKRGVNIEGQKGQIVEAAAPGEVVYSGSGLMGYGNLVIVKHDDEYLSAYAHNSKLLVKEGANVDARQAIAEMGDSGGAKQVMLHFEIRRNGTPVDPLDYLSNR